MSLDNRTAFERRTRSLIALALSMALSAVAVMLSVAFVCGTLVFTDTMGATFDKLFAATSADVDTVIVDGDVVVTEGWHRLGSVGLLLADAIAAVTA